MRSVAIFFVVALVAGALVAPLHAASETKPPREHEVIGELRAIDHRLDVVIRDLRLTDQLADRHHLRGVDATLDQGLQLTRQAEQKVDQALAIVRAAIAEGGKPSRQQIERVENLLNEAFQLTHEAERKIDSAMGKLPEDARKLAEVLKRVDKNADQAIKMLRGIVEQL